MNLIDMLVEETIKNGWSWPERANCITQDSDREIVSAGCHPDDAKFCSYRNGWDLKAYRIESFESRILAYDYDTAIITRDQYESALAAKNDGWIEWGGGKFPPVSTNTTVDVKFKKGYVQSGYPAGEYSWEHNWQGSNIIAYRLHQPQGAEQPEASEEDLNECIGQAPATEWDGEGLPPVGMEIEYKFSKANYRTDFSRGKVLAYGMHNVFMEHWASKNEFIQPLDKIEFRPVRSEAERKRYEAVQALCDAGGGFGKVDEKSGYGSSWFDVYEAIAAGKIPGVKLED